MNDSTSGRRVLDALRTAEPGASDADARLRDQIAWVAQQAGLDVARAIPPAGSGLARASELLAEGQRALAQRTGLEAARPGIAAAADAEHKQARGRWVLLTLVAVIVLIVLIGQAL